MLRHDNRKQLKPGHEFESAWRQCVLRWKIWSLITIGHKKTFRKRFNNHLYGEPGGGVAFEKSKNDKAKLRGLNGTLKFHCWQHATTLASVASFVRTRLMTNSYGAMGEATGCSKTNLAITMWKSLTCDKQRATSSFLHTQLTLKPANFINFSSLPSRF